MKTNKELTLNFHGATVALPKGTKIKFVEGAGGGYAVANNEDLIAAGAWEHDARHRYCYIGEEHIDGLPLNATLVREPKAQQSDNWQDTAHEWRVVIGGQDFQYFTGLGHREYLKKVFSDCTRADYERLKRAHKLTEHGFKKLLANSKPVPPSRDDVLYSLVMDAEACEMSFSEWCSNLGYDTDSRKAFAIYEACQNNADKLRKAGINTAAERERLADY